jgi:hypothetical protein
MWLNLIPALLLPLQFANFPAPQPVLWLSTTTYHLDRAGGESSASGKNLRLGRPTPFVTYADTSMCGFSAGGFTEIAPSAQLGWDVIAVAKSMTPDHVVLSVTWFRQRGHKVETRGATEVLLRPGDGVTLDVAETPEWRGHTCGMTSAEVRLELDPVNWAKISTASSSPVSTDIWLVRRMPGGREETQQINVRGALNEEVPFYFNDLTSGTSAISVLGTVRARANEGGTLSLDISAESQLRLGTTLVERGFIPADPQYRHLVFGSDQEVVAIEFPMSKKPTWQEFAGQVISIRFKTHRLR